MLRNGSDLRIQYSFVQRPCKAKEVAQGKTKLASSLYGLDLYCETSVVTQFRSVLLVLKRSLNV
jgi:hypothetical protein